jgi:hypothetical protein
MIQTSTRSSFRWRLQTYAGLANPVKVVLVAEPDRARDEAAVTATGVPYRGTSVIPRITTGSGSGRTGVSSTRERTTRITSAISA